MIMRYHSILLRSGVHWLVTLAVILATGGAWAASLLVTSAANQGAGTLREAITIANSNGQADTITLGLPSYSLTLLYALPPITEAGTVIDGTGSTATINGGGFNAFVFNAVTGCAVRNFTVAGANYAVLLSGGSGHSVENIRAQNNTWPLYLENSDNNVIRGSVIESNTNGVFVRSGSSGNTIGGTTPSAANYVRGHATAVGILLQDVGVDNNTIIGNIIGLNASGTAPQANNTGIRIRRGANNVVGGTSANQRNIISGNVIAGIWLSHIEAQNNRIEGNWIGTADDGTTPIPNNFAGIQVSDSARLNTIGGATAAHANIIKANLNGVAMTGAGTIRNTVSRNSIYDNGNTGIILTSSANQSVVAPTLLSAAPVTGTTTEDGLVQIFVDDANQGEIYITETTATGGVFSVVASLAAYEGRNLTATLTDVDGNTSIFSPAKLIDVTPPTGGLDVTDPIVIDNNAELLITPAPTDNYSATNDIDMRFSNDGTNWSAWEPYAATKAWDLNFGLVSPTGGPRTVYAQYRDELLNVSTNYTASIEIDITPPSGGLSMAQVVYTTPSVTLDVLPAPTDNNSPLAAIEMRFSNNGVDWTAWEPYAATKAWDLNQDLVDTSDGVRIARVQFRDEAGNISGAFTASAELDTTGPEVTAFLLADANPTTAEELTFLLFFDEPVLNLETGLNPATDDFGLIIGGAKALSGATISNIINNGGNNYTIRVETGPGDGLVSLELLNTGGMTDDHGNPFTGGEVAGPYIVDRLAFTLQPLGGAPTQYEPYTFNVATTGGIGPVHFEWRRNGQPVPDADDAPEYVIPSLALSDTGDWTCVVSDDYISIESDVAELTVQVAIPAASSAGLAVLAAALASAFVAASRRKQ